MSIQSEFYFSVAVTKRYQLHNKMHEKSWEIIFHMHLCTDMTCKRFRKESSSSRGGKLPWRNRIRKRKKRWRFKIYIIFKTCCQLFKVIIVLSLHQHLGTVPCLIGGTGRSFCNFWEACTLLSFSYDPFPFQCIFWKIHPSLLIIPTSLLSTFTKYGFQKGRL